MNQYIVVKMEGSMIIALWGDFYCSHVNVRHFNKVYLGYSTKQIPCGDRTLFLWTPECPLRELKLTLVAVQ